MVKFLKNIAPDAVAILAFLVISFVYFATPISEGLVLGGHDSVASIGSGQEQLQHLAETGERTRWTGTMFSGMPTYQISPSYSSGKLLDALWIGHNRRIELRLPLPPRFLYPSALL